MLVARKQTSAVDEFGSEVDASAVVPALGVPGDPAPRTTGRISLVGIAAALLIVGAVAAIAFFAVTRASTSSRLAIESTPAGAEVLVDGVLRGVTPLELELPPGQLRVVV